MHTTGEPTRIVYSGFPDIGDIALLEQRARAKSEFDHVRKRLVFEPRGHREMYGALLLPKTELTSVGKADMGVLFMTNEGWSTMCGHATIALGRFLLDCHDDSVFPRRKTLKHNVRTNTVRFNLHAPCGLIEVTTPVTSDGLRSDPLRPVSFVCVPSFASGLSIQVSLSDSFRWPELEDKKSVTVDFGYGGTFYAVVDAAELGLKNGLRKVDQDALKTATKKLKTAILQNDEYRQHFTHPDPELNKDVGFLYGILVEDNTLGDTPVHINGGETGICFFADSQVDRSPCGSGVAARVAIKHAKGELNIGESWMYHSLLSVSRVWGHQMDGERGAFKGTITEASHSPTRLQGEDLKTVRVAIEGHAYYTGFATYLVEEQDPLGDRGFAFEDM